MNKKLLASDIIGNVTNPWGTNGLNVPGYIGIGQEGQGLITLLNNLLRVAVVLGGIFSFINLIIAGYGFMAAAGNPEKVAEAWNKIWQSLVGLLIIAGSYVLAAVFGYLIFGNTTAILQPKIFGPN